jgi:hypothetical protein
MGRRCLKGGQQQLLLIWKVALLISYFISRCVKVFIKIIFVLPRLYRYVLKLWIHFFILFKKKMKSIERVVPSGSVIHDPSTERGLFF